MTTENQASVEQGASAATPTETWLLSQWRELFGTDDIDVTSDFFKLGGNSLTALQLLSRADDTFGPEVLLPDTLFDCGQLSQLAKAIDAEMAARKSDSSEQGKA